MLNAGGFDNKTLQYAQALAAFIFAWLAYAHHDRAQFKDVKADLGRPSEQYPDSQQFSLPAHRATHTKSLNLR